MDLSNDLISKFVKITNDDKNKNSESTVYGTVVEYNGGMYVRIDGSDLLTPVETTADFKPNERVTVMIKNHSATVTGNITSPSTNEGAVIEKVTEAVEDVEGKVITEVEILIADRVSTGQLDAEVARIDELIAGKASVEDLTATNAEITNLKADKASVEDLTATNAEITNLKAEDAKIENLLAGKASIKDLTATNAEITNLKAKDAEIENLVADKARIEDLTATNARIDSLQANKADITYLDANFATIDELEAAHADIEILDAELADINTLVNGNLTSDNILSLNITSQNTTMENAFVKDAMIDTVTANKIMSGTIDTNNVTIQSTDGSMLLQGTLLQMKDDNGKVRIQIGKDTGGNFTFILYDESGTGVLIDEEGIKSSDAIADGLIVDAKVADNANIAGSKLDIASVISEVNNDNSTTIKSNKIYLDEQGQSLEVAFNSLKTQVETIQDVSIDGDLTEVIEQVQSNTTQIAANKEGISTLVSENTIRKEEIQNLDGEIESVNNTLSSKYSSLEQDVSGFKTTVADTYTTKSEFNNLQIGGKNLLLDSKREITNNNYLIGSFRPTELFEVGEQYTVSICVTPANGVDYILPFISRGYKPLSNGLVVNGITKQVLSVTFTFDGYVSDKVPVDISDSNADVQFYRFPGDETVTGNTTLHWVKIEKGAKATDWSPAPEDVQGQIDATNNNLQNNYSTTSAMNSAIQQKANEITSTVSETYATKQSVTDINNNLSANYSTTSAMNSAIQQKANEITSSVSETYTTKSEFNNLEVGGRNLLENSSFKKDINKWDANISSFYSFVTNDDKQCCKIDMPGLENGCYLTQSILTDLVYGETYTVSGWVKTENIRQGTTNYCIMFYIDGQYNKNGTDTWYGLGSKSFPINTGTGSWQHISWTFTVDNPAFRTARSCNFFVYARDFTGQVYFYDVKLEKGNKATDWSPAPEDIQGQIDATNANIQNNYSTTSQMNSAIQQKANEITSSVSETYTTKAEFNNLQIGGTNLLPHSGNFKDNCGLWITNGSSITLETVVTYNGYNTIKIDNDSSDGIVYSEYITLKPNTTYTYSITAVAAGVVTGDNTRPLHMWVHLQDNPGTYHYEEILDYSHTGIGTNWGRSYIVFKTPDTNNFYVMKPFIYLTEGQVIYIANFKVEEGNRPTDWSPAPEDVQGQIDATNNNLATNYSTTSAMNSAIQQKANEITSSVSETYATKQSVTDVSNNLSANYSTTSAMNSAINQKANEITSSVSETYATKQSVTDINNNLTNNYSTTSQMNTAIQQKANEITSSVSQTYITNYEAKKLADTTTTGLNKYLFERYQRDGFDYAARPTLNDLVGARLIESQLVDNPPPHTSDLGSNYIGVLTFYLYYDYACTKTVSVTTDDSGTVYLNNVGIYELTSCQPANVTFNMIKGLNRIDIVYAEGGGGDGVSWGGVDGFSAFGAYANVVTNEIANRTNELTLAMTQGNMLYTDPTFRNGKNGTVTYNNLGNNKVTSERIVAIEGCPNTSGYCLKITTNGEATPGLGGFAFANMTRRNAVFITKITAKIPIGYTIGWASNGYGNNGEQKWLSYTGGTGDWHDYYFKVKCGDSGDFSSTNYFYLIGPQASAENPVTWYVSYATVFDVTDSDERITNLTNNLAANYSTTSAMNSAIQQKANEITSSVSQTYATKQSVTDVNNNLANNYSTTSQMNTAIQQKANEITSSVSETYTTKSEFNNLEIGGRNLVQKKNIKYGYLTSSTGNPVSTPSLNGNQDYYSEFYIPVKAGEKYTITTYNSTSSITGFIAAHIYDSNKTWLKAYISEQTNLNSTTPISRTFTIEVDGYMRYSCRGLNSINTKLEKGNRATDWTPAPEDVEAGIDAVADNLANNYSTTSAMNSAIEQKANQITNTVSSTYLSIAEATNSYATKSNLSQTADSLTATFSGSGGYNLIRNGHANKGTSYWQSNGGGLSYATGAGGSVNGNFFRTTMPNGVVYYDWIELKPNTHYVYQAKVYIDGSTLSTGWSSSPLHYHISDASQVHGTTDISILDYQQSISAASTWTQCYMHFVTPNISTVYFKPFMYTGGDSKTFYFSEVMLSESRIALPWSPHPSEVYDGITTIDKDGIKVSHSNANGYTHMAPDGFFVNNNGTDVVQVTASGLYVQGNITSGSTIQGARITGSTFNSSNDVFQVLEDGTIETSFLAVNGAVSTDKLNVNNIENASYPKVLSEATTVYISPNGGVNAEEFYDGAYFTSLSNMLAVAPRNLNGYTLTIRMAGDLYENAALTWFHSGQVNFELQGHTLYGYFYGYGASMCYRLYGNTNANNNGTWGHIKPNVGRAMGSYYYAVQFQYCQFAVNYVAVYPSASSGSSSGGIGVHRGATGIIFNAKACGDMRYLVRAEYAGRVHVNSTQGACNNATFCASTGGIITLNSSNNQAGRSTTGNPYWVGSGGAILCNQVLGMDNVTFNNTSQSGSSSSSGSTTRTVTETIKATSADTYRSTVYNNWKGDGTVRQGDYGHGDCQGCWFFGNNLYTTMNAGTVTKVVIRIQRQSGGVNAAQTLTVKSHNHTSRPSGAPTYTNTIGTCSCQVGSYVDLVITDSATINKLKTCKGLGLSIGSTSSPYAVCSGACSVIITYTTNS